MSLLNSSVCLGSWICLLSIVSACSSFGNSSLLTSGSKEGRAENIVITDSGNSDSGNSNSSNSKNFELSTTVFVVDQASSISLVEAAVASVVRIYRKCQIELQATITTLTSVSDSVINEDRRYALAREHATEKPSLFLVSDTNEHEVAYSYLPALKKHVSSTAWLTSRISDDCLAWIMAHELGHILMNSGVHSAGSKNVMSNNCTSSNWNSIKLEPNWTPDQCVSLRGSEFVRG